MAVTPSDRFLAEAHARGLLTRTQRDDVARLASALAEVGVELAVDEIAVRKGYVSRDKVDALKRALARLRVGRYEVLERIGEGAFGVVWKARDTVLDRIVALKLLSTGRQASGEPTPREWRERFLREARVAVTLNHERIVRGLDCGEADGYLFFAMEYVAGGTLGDRLRRDGRLPEKTALAAGLDVVAALAYVERFGIVHRDLKPDNLFAAGDGHVKVGDLGLAKPTSEEADRGDGEGLAAGTPLYMSPEQIRDGDRVDWRSDVYSLGATLYHLLCGRPPFPAERGRDVFQRHLTQTPLSPREFALDVSPGAASVVLKMLQKFPADRYASLADLEEDLSLVLAGKAPLHTLTFATADLSAVDRAGLPLAPVPPKRRRILVASLAAGAAVAIAGTVGWFQLRMPRAPADPPRIVRVPRAAEDAPVLPTREAVPKEDPRERDARQDLEAVERRIAEKPDDLFGARAMLLNLADRWTDTAAGRRATEKADALWIAIERRSRQEFEARSRRAADAIAGGRYGDALEEFEEMPSEYAVTEAGREAEKARAKVLEEGIGVVDALLRDAYRLARESRFTEAERKVSLAADAKIPERLREVSIARNGIKSTKGEYLDQRADQERRFDHVFATAVLLLGTGDLDAVDLWLVDARTEVSAWKTDLDALHRDLTAASRVPAGTNPPPAAEAPGLRAALFAHLSRGKLPDAESLLDRLHAVGSPGEEEAQAIRRVRNLLLERADDNLANAEQYRTAKEWDKADESVKSALQQVPDYGRARALAAAIQMDRGRIDVAIAALEQILAGPTPPPEAHHFLAQCLVARHDDERAEREFRQFLLGAARDDRRRAEVQASLDEIVKRRRDAAVRELRVKLRVARGKRDNEQVLLVAEEILRHLPDDPDALLAAGEMYADANRVRDAWRAFKRLATTHMHDPRADSAEVRLDELDRRWAATPAAIAEANAARSKLERGEVAQAIAQYDRALVAAPFLAEALAGAAESRLRRRGAGSANDVTDALALLSDLLLRYPDDPRGLTLHAEGLIRVREFSAAYAEARRAMDIDRVRPEPAIVAGDALRALGDAQGALEHYQTSLERARTPRGLLGLALAWEALGSKQNAKHEVEALLGEFPIPPEIGEDVDMLLGRLGLERENAGTPPSDGEPGRTKER